MSFLHDLEHAIEYVEEHLDGEIRIEKAAQKAACSTFHFQRMFSYVVGISISEYIRRRRMTLAAFELQQTDVKVIDLAAKYGYDSQSSFTRAFQQLQGMTPTCARREGASVIAYPRLSFQFIVKGVEGMNFKMVKTDDFQIFGIPAVQDWEDTDEAQWSAYGDLILENGTHDATNIAAGFPGPVLDMIQNDTWDIGKVHLLHAIHFYQNGVKYFMYGWEVPEGGVSDDFTVIDIPACDWAVFATTDPDRFAVMELYKYAYSSWFPSSGYEQVKLPVIEKFNPQTSNTDIITEVWFPVKKK